jgi:hypothetical protein
VLPDPSKFLGYTTSLVGVYADFTASAPLFQWTWTDAFNGTSGGQAVLDNPNPVGPGSGTGGITVTGINGVQLPPTVPSSQATTTASGLAYSRVSQTFNGTVTIKNISGSAIAGPLQILFAGLTAKVTLATPQALCPQSRI